MILKIGAKHEFARKGEILIGRFNAPASTFKKKQFFSFIIKLICPTDLFHSTWSSLNIFSYSYLLQMILTKCDQLPKLFQHQSVDILILGILYVVTALVIVISNSVLLNKLFKKKFKTRADKVFIILSCSDIGVGLFSVPINSLPFFRKEWHLLCKFSQLLRFFTYIPYSFSWIVIIVIALDRVLLITKGHAYRKFITMRRLYYIIILSISLVFGTVILTVMEDKLLPEVRRKMLYTQLLAETCLIIITMVAYIYLFHFVHSKTQKIAHQRHGGTGINKKLMMTVTYTYICLLLFTLPNFAGVVINISITDRTLNRNVQYWTLIMLFSNSYANAFIILFNGRKNKKARNWKICYFKNYISWALLEIKSTITNNYFEH